jgi:hypothetical protein
MDDTTLSNAVVPANNVLRLNLGVEIAFGKENMYFDYILQKYPQILYLHFYATCSMAHLVNPYSFRGENPHHNHIIQVLIHRNRG